MLRWFNDIPRGFQILLLIVPVVNWVIEIGVRWSKFGERPNFWYFLLALFVTIGGLAIAYLDLFWCLFFHHLFCAVSEYDLKH